MQEVQNFTPEARNFQTILTCRTLTEEARPGDIETHGGYLRRSSERMVKRNKEMKRKQQKQTPKEKMISDIAKGGLRKSRAGEKAKVYLRDRHRGCRAVFHRAQIRRRAKKRGAELLPRPSVWVIRALTVVR